ncbi:MAG: subtilisin family serine protease, partial [Arenicella sp.]
MNKASYSSSQHLIVRLLISLWVLTAVVQTASAANSTLLNQPGQFSGVAKPRASSASETAGRRILARFKTNSSFARADAIAVGMQRLLVDKNDRKMPIKGISHLKTLHLSHKKAAAATNTLPEKQLKLQALPVSDDFQLSVLEITDPEADRDVLIKALIATGEVEYAEADVVMSANLMPDDSDFSSLWGLHNTGQSGGTVDADIDAVEAWDITTGSASVVVAVIDTGVRYDHPDLTGNMWRNPGETGLDADGMDKAGNGVDDDFNGYVDDVYGIDCINDDSDPIDDDASSYHGTHVAGIIGARGNNASQVTGVNWNVSIMALKYLGANGRGVVSDAVECLTYAANMKKNHGVNLRVTNNSYGGGNATQSMRDAILATQNQDILFVAAAGNDGEDNDAIPHYPSSYDLPSVVAVASTNRYDTKAETSNYGLVSVDIGAPGVSILSTVGSNNLNTLSGTSMASPQVAGVAALLLAYDPSMTYSQLKARMLDTANPIAALDGLTATGGRLNAFDALNCSAGNINMYFNPVSATQ